ncbi:MAG: ABC transporter permease [Tissierellia bacterium]|nr:ABC transporter permease [Tissierellia bacterium]
MKDLKRKFAAGLGSFKLSFFALFFALLTGAIAIALSGYSPIETYKAIIVGSLGSKQGIILSLSSATPLIFTGLAFATAYKVKMINIGAEGQLYLGAMAGAVVGAYITGLPRLVHIPLTLLSGALVGGLIGILVVFLKVKFGASEIITTIMLNEIILLFTSYLSSGPLKPEDSVIPQTHVIQETAQLTRLAPRSQLSSAIFIAIAAAVLIHILIKKTPLGYEIQVTGLNRRAAETAGISITKMYLITFFLSGAIAGLCGSSLVMGVNRRFVEGISANYGYSGISVAALGAYNPLSIIFSATLFGILKSGAITLNRTTAVPIEFVDAIQAVVVAYVAAPRLIEAVLSLKNKIGLKKEKSLNRQQNLAEGEVIKDDGNI